jgi:hypothetical protein
VSFSWPDFLRIADPFEDSDVAYAQGRLVNRTYVSKSFPLALEHSPDYGQPTRNIWKAFDEPPLEPDDVLVFEEVARMNLTPAGRKQLTIQVAREAGQVRELRLEKVSHTGGKATLEQILRLDRDGATRLLGLLRGLDHIPIEGERSVRVDDSVLAEIFDDPQALERLYSRDPEAFRKVIASDASAEDLVALEHRREQVERFRQLLEDDDAFAAAQAEAGGPEKVWQQFLEANPWILGVGLAGQLLTSYDEGRLEQTVAGFNAWQSGKRVDALLRTAGAIRSLAYAEIKHHRSPLLGSKDYREEVWPPSSDLAGGVTQIQQTVHRAVAQFAEGVRDVADDGSDAGTLTYTFRPRSYLILGHLSELRGTAGVHHAKHRCFELFRRNLVEPEVITFDELLARAEWHVMSATESLAD